MTDQPKVTAREMELEEQLLKVGRSATGEQPSGGEMRLSAVEKKTLRLALNLAIEWESSLEQSYSANSHNPDDMKQIRACQRNIDKFQKLKAKLNSPALGGEK